MDQTQKIDNFIEMMGLISHTEGGPRIAGRIFGLLIVAGEQMSLHEMSERLQISRASASTNARLLADRNVIRLTSRPGERQDYYELVPDPYRSMIESFGTSIQRTARKMAEAEKSFPDEMPEAKRRVKDLSKFYAVTLDLFDDWAKRLPPTN
ncbi:hypothetical protein PSQ90_14760 [Devosia rhodophyticola]|uniref:HTH-type transcriptional regulator n=1 Tax=Devosia rhodophyticola TaxID=3026423 RepID=A0ABY7YWA8_9HYPH|nr:hypothetical protein [Devosia rhodophyticola]WDR05521.1 hypothetical protein PSQ90_14760 [Devosia rhodophyticola]